MKIEFYCPRWGSEQLNWDTFLRKVKKAGYVGVEYALPNYTNKEALKSTCDKIKSYGLKLILQHYDTYESDFEKHCVAYKDWLTMVKNIEVVKINSQTGKDFFSFEQNNKLIAIATKFGSANNVNICHETHRNKFSFACHTTKPFLEYNANLKITLDISHWVLVAESYLEDQVQAIALALLRTEHIHARVGHTEGPQVTDPQAPEWQEALQQHLLWWDRIIARKRLNKDKVVTITTEFGPSPYMITHPFTNKPIANQWNINLYMKELLQQRYI